MRVVLNSIIFIVAMFHPAMAQTIEETSVFIVFGVKDESKLAKESIEPMKQPTISDWRQISSSPGKYTASIVGGAPIGTDIFSGNIDLEIESTKLEDCKIRITLQSKIIGIMKKENKKINEKNVNTYFLNFNAIPENFRAYGENNTQNLLSRIGFTNQSTTDKSRLFCETIINGEISSHCGLINFQSYADTNKWQSAMQHMKHAYCKGRAF